MTKGNQARAPWAEHVVDRKYNSVLDLSVCIVSYNTRRLLRDCVASIYKHVHSIKFEAIVVDNASSDGSPDEIRRLYPQVRIIENLVNVGFARANNQAIEHSCGRYVLLLNSDTVAMPGTLDALVSFMDAHPEAGAAGGKLVNPDGTTQVGFNVRSLPSLKVLCYQLLLLDRLLPNSPVMRRYWMSDWDHSDVREVEQPAGTCLIVRRKTIDQVGLMDESFFYWYEDVDWCLRIRNGGWKIFYIPQAQVIHYGGKSSEQWDKERAAVELCKSRLRYVRKHYSRAAFYLVKGLTAIGMVLRMGVFLALSLRRNKSVSIPNVDWNERCDAIRAYWRALKIALSGK
jgi:GT2 family glycosyltransferase